MLKLRWARFFTLMGWKWTLSRNPNFTFQVSVPCHTHRNCCPHKLRVRICEKNYAALITKFYDLWGKGSTYGEPNPALFGDGPANTFWTMVCGEGGGEYSLNYWGSLDDVWEQAAHD